MKLTDGGFICLLFIVLYTVPLTMAQGFKASLIGQVMDSNGAAVKGATVTVRQVGTETTQTTTTGEDGNFTLAQLAPGLYEVVTEAPNFRRTVQTNLNLETNQTARITIVLEAGNISEAVTVTAEPPTLNSDISSKGEVITEVQVQNLPLNGRNFTDLALLTPGIYRVPDSTDQGGGVSSSGTRTDSSNYILDGVTNRSDRIGGVGVQTSVDAIQEFKVLTSTYSAEFGRTAGAQINVVSKSGTNKYRGTVFNYVRNDVFDAKEALAFDLPTTPIDESRKTLRRNQFGFTFGGPLPFLNFGEGVPVFTSGKDKTFFFVSYEGTRERRSSIVTNQVAPTVDWLRGDFSRILGAGPDLIPGTPDDVPNSNRIFDPVTRLAFPGNIIPPSRINPAARSFAALVPAANIPGSVTGYFGAGRDTSDVNQFSIRGDRRFSEKNNAYFRYSLQNITAEAEFPQNVFYPGFGSFTDPKTKSLAISDTHIFSPNLIAEFRFGYYKQNNFFGGQDRETDYNALFGIPGVSPGGIYNGYANINIDGFPQFGDRPFTPLIFDLKNYQFYSSLTWIRGNHNLKFGVDLVRSNFIQAEVNGLRGNFRFRGRNTNTPNANPNALAAVSSGFRSFADFLLGLPEQSNRQVGIIPADLNGWQYGLYVQDDWRVTNWLTLNLGLRYEMQTPLNEANNNLSSFVPEMRRVICARTVTNAAGQQVCTLESGFSETLISTDDNNFAPRLGFALRPFGDDKTVIRGGAGIFYSLETFNSVRGVLSGAFPFVTRQQVTRIANDLNFTLSNPFPANRITAQGTNTPTGLSLETKTPTVYQYNLTVEREIVKDLAFEIGYVGSQGRFLGRRYNINQPIFSFVNNAQTSVVPFPQFGNITFQENAANSNYNAVQASIRRRSKGGLTLLASYTFSRSIDDNSSTANSTFGAQNLPQNVYNFEAERGLSDFHRKHQFSGSFNYALPFGKGKTFFSDANGLLQALIGGLQINGIVTALSGRPFTPQYALTTTGAAQRPNLVGDPLANVPAGLEFNPAAFVQPVPSASNPGAFGNAGRNILITPPFRTVDFSVINNVRVREGLSVQLRAEAFNIFNTPNYRVPAFRLDQPNVGQLTETISPGREFQFAIKILFR